MSSKNDADRARSAAGGIFLFLGRSARGAARFPGRTLDDAPQGVIKLNAHGLSKARKAHR